MRWVVLSLLLINALVFAFFMKQSNQPKAEAEPLAELEGKNIKLISELDPSLLVEKKKHKGKSLDEVKRCYSVGPFVEQIDAKHMKARAQALGFVPELRQLTASQQSEYWVYISPLESRQLALQLLKKLHKRKIDSYVITSGDLSEGISLGLFRNEELAIELHERMLKQGYDALIKPVSRGKKELWMEFKEIIQLTEEMRHKVSADNARVQWMLVQCSEQDKPEEEK